MNNVINLLAMYLQYPFVRYALICGIMISICTSLLGVTLVLKNYALIGDGLSHIAFGVMCIAIVMNLNNTMVLILPITILAAIFLLKSNSITVKGDAAIGFLSVMSLAMGYMVMNIFASPGNLAGDVCTTLFGATSILTLTEVQVIISIVLSTIVMGIYFFSHNKIFAITYDEEFAKASGMNVNLYNLLLAIITGIVVVLAMNLVGSLLVSALIIFPSLSARCICKSYKSVVIYSLIYSFICVLVGEIVAILLGTPVGSTIVMFEIIIFIITMGISKVKT